MLLRIANIYSWVLGRKILPYRLFKKTIFQNFTKVLLQLCELRIKLNKREGKDKSKFPYQWQHTVIV